MPTLWPETAADVLVSFSWTWPQAFLNKASTKAIERANAAHPARKGGKELYPTATVSIMPAANITISVDGKWVDLGYVTDEGITFEPQVPNVQSWGSLPTQQFSDPPAVVAFWDGSITGKFVPTPEQITALKASVDEAKMLADTAAASMKAVLDDKIMQALKVPPSSNLPTQQPKVHALRAIVHGPCTAWFAPDAAPGDQLWFTNKDKAIIGYANEATTVQEDVIELYSWDAAEALATYPPISYEVTWRPHKTEHSTISNVMERGHFTSANEVKATLGTYRPNTDTWVLEIGGGGFVETENSEVMANFGMVPGFMTATGPVLSAAQIVAGYQELGYNGGVFGGGSAAVKQAAAYAAFVTGKMHQQQSHQPKAARLQEFIPGLRESKPFRCPVPGCDISPQAVWYQIQHINDAHSMSREQIADWLDSLEGIDLTVHLPEDEITEKKEA